MAEPVRIGLLRLADAAPLILAEREGIFRDHGLSVSLSVEPSWANVADKLTYGQLDAAAMLPPLAIACAAGLRGREARLAIPVGLSAAGNSIALAAGLASRFDGTAASLTAIAAETGRKLRLAVVHAYSTHDLLVRHWLAASGIRTGESVTIVIVPPAEMVRRLAAGEIDGFCAGAPWADVAVAEGIGIVAVRTGAIWSNHPEKCLAVREAFATGERQATLALIASVAAAGARAAMDSRRDALARLLAEPRYLDLPVPVVAHALAPANGGPLFGGDALLPRAAQGRWFARELLRWGERGDLERIAAELYRPDLYEAAGGVPIP